MLKQLITLLLITSACLFTSCTPTSTQEISILPTPVSMIRQQGAFVLRDGVAIGVSDSALLPAAGYLQEVLGHAVTSSVEVVGTENRTAIRLQLMNGCGKPNSYKLHVAPDRIYVEAEDCSGIVSAISTIRQLLPPEIERPGAKRTFSIPAVQIEDAPRFEWRGFMLDASRHFWSKEEVKHVLDLMALYKLNKFHWHLTDDQGWRIEIKRYPALTEKESWRKLHALDRICMERAAKEDDKNLLVPADKMRTVDGDTLYGGYYTQEDVREIVAYAAGRGIDVIPEIDMPGHFLAAINQYPELACDGLQRWGEVYSSPICLGKDATLEFCQNVYKEIFSLFPYEYVHIGGDEVDKSNWEKCTHCQKRVREEKLTSTEALQAWFIRNMEQFFRANGKKLVGWDEVVEDGLSQDAAFCWWRGWAKESLPTATANKQKVIACTNEFFYFDYTQDKNSVKNLVGFDPCADPRLSDEQKEYVWGVQANLWTEWIPTLSRLEYQALPRMMVLSEIAWEAPEVRASFDGFYQRLASQFKRLDVMGVSYRIPDLQGCHQINAFVDEAVVKVTCPLAGVNIRYTTDGSIPTSESALYPGELKITESTDFTFRTFRPDGSYSDVLRARYVKAPYTEAVAAPANLQKGLKAVWYAYRGDRCANIETGHVKGEYVLDSISIPQEVKGVKGFIMTGYLEVPADDIYTFSILSDDGCTLQLDGEMLGESDGPHSPIEIVVQKALKAGLHPIEFRYFDWNEGVLQFEISRDEANAQDVRFFH